MSSIPYVPRAPTPPDAFWTRYSQSSGLGSGSANGAAYSEHNFGHAMSMDDGLSRRRSSSFIMRSWIRMRRKSSSRRDNHNQNMHVGSWRRRRRIRHISNCIEDEEDEEDVGEDETAQERSLKTFGGLVHLRPRRNSNQLSITSPAVRAPSRRSITPWDQSLYEDDSTTTTSWKVCNSDYIRIALQAQALQSAR